MPKAIQANKSEGGVVWNSTIKRRTPLPKPTKPLPRGKAPNKVSKKRAVENKIYAVERIEFLKKFPLCQASISEAGCLGVSSQVHHPAGRIGELFLDKTKWLALCPPCHHYIEMNPDFAKRSGFSVSRLAKDK